MLESMLTNHQPCFRASWAIPGGQENGKEKQRPALVKGEPGWGFAGLGILMFAK